MARYRKPDSKKKVAGTFRPDRAKRPTQADGMTVAPSPPEHLTSLAQTEWDRLAPLICEQRTMTQADLRGFELLCETLGTAQLAQDAIARDGLTLGVQGKVRAHPATKILEAARSQATRLLIEFGLTPRSRAHVEPTSDAGDDKNPFAGLG